VRGIDREGYFEGKRRYNDFNALRNLLVTRFPGLVIPILPPKKAIVIFKNNIQGQQRDSVFARAYVLLRQIFEEAELE
jgi:PX domain